MGLSYCYADGTKALESVSFSLEQGESVALLGPNGAGKSTLLLHLNGLLRGQGSVRVLNREINEESLAWIRSQVGMVFQDPDDQLFMPSLQEDVAFGPANMGLSSEEVQERVAWALAVCGPLRPIWKEPSPPQLRAEEESGLRHRPVHEAQGDGPG